MVTGAALAKPAVKAAQAHAPEAIPARFYAAKIGAKLQAEACCSALLSEKENSACWLLAQAGAGYDHAQAEAV